MQARLSICVVAGRKRWNELVLWPLHELCLNLNSCCRHLHHPSDSYYPPFFYPAIGKIAKSFLPKFTTAYYLKVQCGVGCLVAWVNAHA
jgi:hypothetical protein